MSDPINQEELIIAMLALEIESGESKSDAAPSKSDAAPTDIRLKKSLDDLGNIRFVKHPLKKYRAYKEMFRVFNKIK